MMNVVVQLLSQLHENGFIVKPVLAFRPSSSLTTRLI